MSGNYPAVVRQSFEKIPDQGSDRCLFQGISVTNKNKTMTTIHNKLLPGREGKCLIFVFVNYFHYIDI